MIVTTEITESAVRTAVDRYLADLLGAEYRAGHGQIRNGHWRFMVECRCKGMSRNIAVGGISVDAVTGQVEEFTDDQIWNMREAGEVQAAQERRELPRDKDGFVLRRYAQIKANVWISNRVGLKIRAEGGMLVPLDPPVWRFSIYYHNFGPLTVMDVNAKTGRICPLSIDRLEAIQEDVRAIRQFQTLAPAA